jgi:LPS-assembly protein
MQRDPPPCRPHTRLASPELTPAAHSLSVPCRIAALLLVCALPWTATAAQECPRFTASDDAPELRFTPQLTLTGDLLDLIDGEVSEVTGGVEVRQFNRVFQTEALELNAARDGIRLPEGSVFRTPQILVRSTSAEFNLRDASGTFYGTDFAVTPNNARGHAETLELDAAGRVRLAGARYTTCAPQREAWRLDAGEIRLDAERGLGTARNAVIRIGNVPVLYLPYFQFPIDDRRRTGLLFPTLGQSDNTGFDLRWPVYLNLHPQFDATLTPRLMSRRGVQLGTQTRYLFTSGTGEVNYDVLPSDRLVDRQSRSYVDARHRGLINRRLAVDARYAEVSDRRYFEDLGGGLDLAALTHLERSLRLTYQAPGSYTLTGLIQDYQTIAFNVAPDDDPFRRLPQLRLAALTPGQWRGLRAGLDAEYVNFARRDSIEGQRLDARPFVRYTDDQLSRYTVAEIDWRYTRYELTDALPGQTRQPWRMLPTVGAETGLRFDRITDAGAVQTLEPKLFYLYTPFESQSDLPVFDSGEPDFDFTQLFARNRFTGSDRVSDAHHVAMAATTRLLDPDTGTVRWSASVGQLYRLQAPRVALPDVPLPDNGPTDFIAAGAYNVNRRLSAQSAVQWSPDEEQVERAQVGLRYVEGDREARIAYRYRAEILEQGDLAFQWPLWGGFTASQLWRYSLRDRQTLDVLTGLGYEDCCWGIRMAYRRFLTGTEGRYDAGVYLQFELKGLTRFGGSFSPFEPRGDARP